MQGFRAPGGLHRFVSLSSAVRNIFVPQLAADLLSPPAPHGQMVWEGSVAGNRIRGTMHWTRERWYRTVDVTHEITGDLISEPSNAADD